MRLFEFTLARGTASAVRAPGALEPRLSGLAPPDTVNAAAAWAFSFVFVLALGSASGGYWPTTWGWTAVALLFVCAVIVLVANDLRVIGFEAIFPAALLGLALWGVASAAWSVSATQPLLLGQRSLVYVAVAFVALLLVRRRSYRHLLGGVWAAITLLCCYGLLTRLFPERIGYFDSIAGYRLQAPLGYWNAFAIFAAMGTLLAVGFAARGRSAPVRMLAAASTVFLVPALYFSFSRGGWIALGLGLVAMVALDSRRLQLITMLVVVAPWPALAVWHASGSEPLTHIGGGLAAATDAGHRYTLFLAGVALGAAGAMLVYFTLERRVRVPEAVRIGYAVLLLLTLVAALGAVTVRYGSPVTIARDGYHHIAGAGRPIENGDLNTRLFSLGLGQRVQLWKVAWREYTERPWLGTGAGSYERYWNEHRVEPSKVRNVHNLYLEELAELGPVGLGLLLVALGLPLVAAVRARRRALVPAAAGAYIGFLVHAAVDWDWQMPAVTLAALLCGVALVAASRRAEPSGTSFGPVWRGVALALLLVLGVFAFVGLKGNRAIAASEHAAASGNWAKSAAEARSARFWSPWSARPWQLLGEAEAAAGDLTSARASFRRGIAKDSKDWSLWLDLAVASSGAEQRQAFAAATRLNPLSPEIASHKLGVR